MSRSVETIGLVDDETGEIDHLGQYSVRGQIREDRDDISEIASCDEASGGKSLRWIVVSLEIA